MSGSGSEEETYSIMFSSLKHPARRKILRMLSNKALTYSEMLEALSIPSSHLTYHLDNLGDLIVKDQDGKYKLSSFGKASVSMMQNAEDVPDIQAQKFSSLPFRWKGVFAILLVAIVVLASFSAIQLAYFNSLSSDYDSLKADYADLKAQNQQLLTWNPSTTKAMSIIKDVIQLDVSKYEDTLESSTAQIRSDLGNVIEEVFKYSLSNSQSSFELTLRFRNGHFSMFQLTQSEGYPNFPPVYLQRQSTDVLQATKDLIQRYHLVANDTYLDDVVSLLTSTNNLTNDLTWGDAKLKYVSYGNSAEVWLMYSANGTDFEAKTLHIKFDNQVVVQFTDDWFLFNVGSTQINISQDQAVLIAKNAARNFSWNANGTQVSNPQIVDNPVSAVFYPKSRNDPLTLMPYWLITLYLDQTYPGGVNAIVVGIWADTGEVANIQTSTGQA
jgi:hypothetical protein